MMNLLLRQAVAVILLTLAIGMQAKTYLVSIGVADYSGYPTKLDNLRLTTKDAQTIADLYSDNASVEYALLLDNKATKEKIIKAMSKVFNKAGEDDNVVFYFSGHGYPGGLCVYDGTFTYKKVREAMAESKCKNKIMFIDACHAGGMRVDDKSADNEVNSSNTSNVMLFLSSRNSEYSKEPRELNNGLFTTYLIKGLKGKADTDRDRVITAKELFDFVSSNVARESQENQHPVMWGNFSTDMPVMKW